MRRAAVTAAFAAVLVALTAAAPASAAGSGVPKVHGGSVLGQDLPLKVYASIDPGVHLFGDPITARVAVVADRKWVAPANVHVIVHFHPYQSAAPPTVVRAGSGRLLQITWTWHLHCLTAKCLPVTKTSDLARVFKFSPAHIEYVAPTGQVRYSLDARFQRIAVLSELSPSEVIANPEPNGPLVLPAGPPSRARLPGVAEPPLLALSGARGLARRDGPDARFPLGTPVPPGPGCAGACARVVVARAGADALLLGASA